jgi:hypothetical protein
MSTYVLALPWDLFFFKLTQPLTVSTIQLLYTVKEKWGKPDRKLYPLLYGLWNPYKSLKSENSQDYAQKPQRNCTFMDSASGMIVKSPYSVWSLPVEHYRPNRQTFMIRLPQNTQPFLPSRERRVASNIVLQQVWCKAHTTLTAIK